MQDLRCLEGCSFLKESALFGLSFVVFRVLALDSEGRFRYS